MSIIEPWPPTDPTAPLPYDQRGCCWPWGPDGPQEKAQLRYGAAVFRNDGGSLHPAWNILSTDPPLFIPTIPAAVLLNEGNWYTSHTASIFQTIFILFDPITDSWGIEILLAKPGLPVCEASTSRTIPSGGNTDEMVFTLDTVTGPGPNPDRMRVVPFRWFEDTAPYRFLP